MIDRVMPNDQLSPAQVRAARSWLGWSQDELAMRSGVSQRSIARIELERSFPYATTLSRLRKTFEDAGLCFLFEGGRAKGVRLPWCRGIQVALRSARSTAFEQVAQLDPKAGGNILERSQRGVSPSVLKETDGLLIDVELRGKFVLGPTAVLAQFADIPRQRLCRR